MDLKDAQGKIGPNHYSDDPTLRAELLDGRWLESMTTSTPTLCIDGRPPADSGSPRGPRTAGGTIGLWVAENLADQAGGPIKPIQGLLEHLDHQHLPIGAHTGPTHSAEGSGCGAADNLNEVLNLLDQHTKLIREMVATWGADPNLIDAEMLQRARQIVSANFTGQDLVVTVKHHPSASISDLGGDHTESLAVINLRPQTTINNAGLGASRSPAPQIFSVDAWAFPLAAQVIDPNNVDRIAAALAAFNAAALLVLVSPGFPSILLERARAVAPMQSTTAEKPVRVDIWLWATRQLKSRSLATKAARAGHVRINGATVKASTGVKVGDEVRLRVLGFDRVLLAKSLPKKRLGAPLAQKCYQDQSPPRPAFVPAAGVRDPGTGRPTKRERRQLEELRGEDWAKHSRR